MSDLIAGLAGAPQAASNNQSYYTSAMNNEINAAGSPAATDFLRLQNAALRPEFASNDAQLTSSLAATGLGLGLIRAVMQLSGGDLELAVEEKGRTRLILLLPAEEGKA